MGGWARCAFLWGVCGLLGCGGVDAGFAVALTLRFDASVSDDLLTQVDTLEFVGSGDELYDSPLTLARAPQRTERVIYRPASNSRALGIAVRAEAAAGRPSPLAIAFGSAPSIELSAGKTTTAEITLSAGDADLGTTDLGPPDLVGADLLERPCPATAVCIGFEEGNTWNADTDGTASITVDGVHTHSGQNALHLHLPANQLNDRVNARVHEPTGYVAGKAFWARAYLYAATPLPLSKMIFFQLTSETDGSAGLRVEANTHFFAMHDYLAGANLYQTTPKPLVPDQWTCVEWQVPLGTAVHLAAYADSSSLLGLDGPTQANPVAGDFALGLFTSVADAADANEHDIWFDDVVLDVNRPGCL